MAQSADSGERAVRACERTAPQVDLPCRGVRGEIGAPPFLADNRLVSCRGGRVAKLVDSLVADAVKRLVLNPEYMRAAWMREVENSMIFGMTTDEMLVRGLEPDSYQLPHFAGTHCYPIFPGPAAQ